MGNTWGQKVSAKLWSTRRSICYYCWAASRSVRKPRCRSSPGWPAGRHSPAWIPSASAGGGWRVSALRSESPSPSPGRKLLFVGGLGLPCVILTKEKSWWRDALTVPEIAGLISLTTTFPVHAECVSSWSVGTKQQGWAPRPPTVSTRTEKDWW